MAMKHGGRGPGHLSRWTAATSPIPYLFASGSQGAWFDFTDTSTWYQDAARTTPAATLGDVVGLVLDKSRGLALGPELVTNGDFASGTTGWASGATLTSTAAATGGRIQVTTTSAFGRQCQALTLVVGQTYTLTGTARMVSGGGYAYLAVGFNTQGDSITTSAVLVSTDTALQLTFVPTHASVTISLSCSVSGSVGEFDNISVKLLAGNHASQATTAQKPLRARIPLGGRRNMLLYTNDFSSGWNFVNSTKTANATTNPVGGADAIKLITNNASPNGAMNQSVSKSGSALTYTFELYAKPAEWSWVELVIWDGSAVGTRFWFNVTTGAVGATAAIGAGFTSTSYSMVSVGSGWYRCICTATSNTATALQILAYSSNADATASTGDGTSGIYLWGAQLELGASATAYQKVVADWDVTESGVTSIPALYFDGSDDSLATAAIDFATCTSDGAARRNMLDCRLRNPVGVTGFTTFGDAAATFTVVSDTAALTSAGLISQNDSGNVWKLDNSAGVAPAYARVTNALTLGASTWTFSTYARGSGTMGLEPNAGTWTGAAPAPALSASYQQISTTGTSNTSSNQWRLSAAAGAVVYFVMIQAEVGATATAFQDIGTDKMTVFAGVEKLSDASAPAMLLELSASTGANAGAFYTTAPESTAAGNCYGLYSRGSVAPAAPAKSTVGTAPDTAVLTGLMNIGGDSAILRRNGAEVGTNSNDQGTGNFGNYALYLGRRGGASAAFKGYMIGHMVIVGKLANASEIAAVEATERAATGAY